MERSFNEFFAQIAAGWVACKNTGVSLSAMQCFAIATYAQQLGHFYMAVDWMETALEKIRRQNDTSMEEYTAAILLHASKQLVRTTAAGLYDYFSETFYKLQP